MDAREFRPKADKHFLFELLVLALWSSFIWEVGQYFRTHDTHFNFVMFEGRAVLGFCNVNPTRLNKLVLGPQLKGENSVN